MAKRDITVQEAAEHMGVHPESVRRWLRRNLLRGYKLGRAGWRIQSEDLEVFIQSRMNDRENAAQSKSQGGPQHAGHYKPQ